MYVNPFDENFVFATEFEQYSGDIKTINYYVTNVSYETIAVGSGGVYLLIYKDNKWQFVDGKKEISIQFVGAILEPGDTITGTLNVEEYFYLPLESGTYCLYDFEYISKPFQIVEN